MQAGIRLTEAQEVNPNDDAPRQRYEIVGYNEIPITHITANPHNPRPSFHLEADDPYLMSLGDSIRTTGQHRPALVFEIVGHYELPDNLGHFRLLQGERRFRACGIAGVDHLRCLIVRTPATLAEELEWLGIEEAFKEDWQFFFLLQFAARLAHELNVPLTSKEITSRTGLDRGQLNVADKLFKLEEPIQDLVQEYEEMAYRSRQGKPQGKATRKGEFGANKAAVVYDICCALQDTIPQVTKQMSSLDLQMKMSAKVIKDHNTLEQLTALLQSIRARDDVPGTQTLLAELLENPTIKISNVLKQTGHVQVNKYRKLMVRVKGLEASIRTVLPHMGQIGTDSEQLREDLLTVTRLSRVCLELERGIEEQLKRQQ